MWKKKKIIISGSTGIAASDINGHTLHNVIGDIGYGKYKDDECIMDRITRADILVIDEISMVGDALFRKVDERFRNIRDNVMPFGGVQLVVVGDFKQLQPVKDKYCNIGKLWEECGFVECSLNTRQRSSDDKLNKLLDYTRNFSGTVSEFKKDPILKDFTRTEVTKATCLYSTNEEVSKNLKIPGNAVIVKSEDKGSTYSLNNATRLPATLNIWEGGHVMNIINDKKTNIYNGDRGHVVSITNDIIKVKFNTRRGNDKIVDLSKVVINKATKGTHDI